MSVSKQPQVVSGKGSAHQLLLLQALAEHSLVISVTRKCPLSCAHCITSSSPSTKDPLLTPELAMLWAEDFGAMAQQGLLNVSLTGGEPILALDAVGLIVRAASANGLAPFIVTSGAWAKTPSAAARVVDLAGPVAGWDIGADAWHAAEMPLKRIDHALSAITQTDAHATVRVCTSDDPDTDAKVMRGLEAVVRGRATIMTQRVRSIGRATGHSDMHYGGLPQRPCISTGLFVRADGTTGPCCAGLAYECMDTQPMTYGTVRGPGDLARAWRDWCSDPLLGVMRFASVAALTGWLPPDLQGETFSEDPCEACVSLWPRLSTEARQALVDRSRQGAVADKLDALKRQLWATPGIGMERAAN